MGDDGMVDDATIGDDGMVNLGAIDLGAGKEPGPAEDGRSHVEEIEARQFTGDIEVRFKEIADRANVFPIALKHIREDAMCLNALRNDVLAEVGEGVVQKFTNDLPVED